MTLEMSTRIDTDAPRRQLVTFLSLGTIAVWAYTVLAAAQTAGI